MAQAGLVRRVGRWILHHRIVVVISWLLLLLGSGFAAGSVGADWSQNFSLPKSDSQQAFQLLKDRFPAVSGDTVQIVFHTKNGKVTDPALVARMEKMFTNVEKLPYVTAVASPYVKGTTQAGISPNGKIAFALVQLSKSSNLIPNDASKKIITTAEAAQINGLQIELGGNAIEQAQQQSSNTAELIGLLAAIVILLFTFGSVVAMGLPIVTALIALGTSLSLVTLATHVINIANFTPQLASMIGLGVGIDYALFIVTRYRQALQEGYSTEDAILLSLDTSGRAVLFAGTTVIIALMGMLLMGIDFLYALAVSATLAVGLTMAAALTLLPVMLSWLGPRIDSLSIHPKRRKQERAARDLAVTARDAAAQGGERSAIPDVVPAGSKNWERWSGVIQRHPGIAAILSAGFLFILCIPALSLNLGITDAGSDPPQTTTRQAYDLLSEGFGAGVNGPFSIVISLPPKTTAAQAKAKLAALQQQVQHTEGIVLATPAIMNPAGTTAVLTAYPASSPQSDTTRSTLLRLRNKVIPAYEQQTGTQVYIGGNTAIFEDFSHLLAKKLPLFIGVVILLSALLLLLVFRSLFVPFKAVCMNLLSIGASFGVIVAIFQWGWGADLLGVEGTGPILAFLPVFLFAIVFGLSMDYEVFLMTRIHEEWVRDGDAKQAVTRGLATTGRVITAAAFIMIAVFLSFAMGDERTIKLFGIGMAVAVFLDAVIIRTILVPALMELAGKGAWWIPGWLDKILPPIHEEPREMETLPSR